MIDVPHSPSTFEFSFQHQWNGTPCPDDRLWVQGVLSQKKEGLLFSVSAPMLHDQRVPDAPMGSRVDGLWKYDVVELFLVGPGHTYLEIELGAGGHFLTLGFDSIRKCSNAYKNFVPVVRFERTHEKCWKSEVVIPWSMIPENVRALNIFSIMAGHFLAMFPVPGMKPDFHQPDFFPQARF